MIDMVRENTDPHVIPCLGVDFGAGTLVAIFSLPGRDIIWPPAFSGFSLEPGINGEHEALPVIPALIHYNQAGGTSVGGDVVRAGHAHHPSTARWIRSYLLDDSRIHIPGSGGSFIPCRDAAAAFLETVLSRAVQECSTPPEGVFSVPDGAPGWYPMWLCGIARKAGIRTCHTIGEYAAAVTGYGLSPEQGETFVMVRFDEATLSVAVVNYSTENPETISGEMRIIGEAHDDMGYPVIDTWITQDILSRNRIPQGGAQEERISKAVTDQMVGAYSRFAAAEEIHLKIPVPHVRDPRVITVSRDDVRRILDERGFTTAIDRLATRALAVASSHGSPGEIAAVLLLGGGCTIPRVQEIIREQFSGVRLLADHPIDAIARGAAQSVPTVKRNDRIRNNYALRYWDASAREHRYRFLVYRGTRYPSAGQVARITISAAYDGQTRLGIPIYEISAEQGGIPKGIELVSDPDGGVRLATPEDKTDNGNRPMLINGKNPTLLPADPPAVKGEPRFELTFILDHERQLCVTARDLVTGGIVKKNTPVFRLD